MLELTIFSWYNQEKYSDITVATAAVFEHDEDSNDYDSMGLYEVREVKCHKIVLAQASEYFRKKLSQNNTNEDTKDESLCLYSDELNTGGPHNDAALMHCYGFEYPEICASLDVYSPTDHLDIVKIGQKYLLPKQKALAGLRATVEEVQMDSDPFVFQQFFYLVKALLNDEAWDKRQAANSQMQQMRRRGSDPGSKIYKSEFEALAKKVLRRNLPRLFKMKDFRWWLEEENESIVDYVMEALEQGYSCND